MFSFVASILVLINTSFLEVSFGFYYYLIFFCMFLILLFSTVSIKFNSNILFLILTSFFSILLNDIPSFFRPYERFVAFLMVLSLISPLVSNPSFSSFRILLFYVLNFFIILFVLVSFVGIALKLPIMEGKGGYTGVFSHSMILGPMSAIALLSLLNIYFNSIKSFFRWIIIFFAAIAFITCLAAGSRAAILAGLAGIIFYFYKVYQGKFYKFIGVILFVIMFAVFSFPLWQSYTETISNKMEYSEDHGDILFTRSSLWRIRFSEFLLSPFIGVGFSAVDINIQENRFDVDGGRVEPGSSWLVLLSMIGLVGFIPFFLLVFHYLKSLLKEKNFHSHIGYLGSLLVFFIVHMFAEGYVLSAGSGMFFYFWLLLGVIDSRNKILIKF